jgi:hypothetical protein
MRSPRSCRRFASPLAAVLVASLAMVAAPVAPGSAVATAPGTLSELRLASSGLAVTSSTHHKLIVTIDAQVSEGVDNATVNISLPNASEAHIWTFNLPSGLFKQSASGVTLTLHNAQLAPFGLLKLIGTNAGTATTTNCGEGDYGVVQPISLSGRLFFNPHSTGRQRWGGVGNKNKNLTFNAGSTVTTEYGTGGSCNDANAVACSNGPELTILGATLIVSAQTNGKKTLVDALRGVELPKPNGASRLDEAVATANKPTIHILNGGIVGSADLELTTPKSSRASGGFSMSSTGKYMRSTDPCHRGSVNTQEHDKFWDTATYSIGTPTLRIPEQVFGVLKLPQDHSGAVGNFRILSPDPA